MEMHVIGTAGNVGWTVPVFPWKSMQISPTMPSMECVRQSELREDSILQIESEVTEE